MVKKIHMKDNYSRQDGEIGTRFTFSPEVTKNRHKIYIIRHPGH